MSNTTSNTEIVATTEATVEAPKRGRGRPRVLSDEQRIEHRKAAAARYQANRKAKQEQTVTEILAMVETVNVARLNKEGKETLAEIKAKVASLQTV
jgi:plasmid stabilization system protein ParE